MRQALNDNPVVQMVVLGLAAVVLAFIVFTTVLKKEDAPAETAASSDPALAATDPAVAAATPAPTPTTGTVTPPAETPASATDQTTGDIKASAGLPRDVLAAYDAGKAIVLVVVDPKAEGNAAIVRAAKGYGRGEVEVFVVDVADIARYSRITQGVSVSRTPAIVVVSPRDVSGGTPLAAVSYGFRSPRSVEQAINDGFYRGRNVPAYP